MSTVSGFQYDSSGGPVSGRAMAAFAHAVAPNGAALWTQRYDNHVLACERIEVVNGTGGATARITGLVAVVGGRLVVEPELTCTLNPTLPDVYLVATSAIEVLDPDVPGGLQAAVVRGTLTADPPDGPRIRLLCCSWSDGSPREARAESDWWPPVTRIADHPYSRAAAQELCDLLGHAGPATGYLLSAATRGEEVAWPAIIHAALTLVAERLRDRPGRIADLDRLAREPQHAVLVSGLLRLLRADRAGTLPPWLVIDGRRARLVGVLHDAVPVQRFGLAGAEVVLEYEAVPNGGWLAVAVAGMGSQEYRLAVTVDGEEYTAIRAAGRTAEPVTRVTRNSRVRVQVRTTTDAPTLIGVGIYESDSR